MEQKFDLKETISEVLSGNQDAFRQIILEFSPTVRVYLRGHLSDAHKVDDLCQEVFMAVYWNLESYNDQFSFRTWVQAIAKNKLMSYLRSYYSQQKMMQEMKLQICEIIDQEVTFEQEDDRLINQLRLCVNKQSEENASLLKQRYFEKVSVIEIAKGLKTSVSAISSQLYRLRKQLKTCIERSLVT